MSLAQHDLDPSDEPYSRPASSLKEDTLAVPSFGADAHQGDSALDTTADTAPYAGSLGTPLDTSSSLPPGKRPASERIRRRSDLSRLRAPDSPPLFRGPPRGTEHTVAELLPDGIELPVLTYIAPISEEAHVVSTSSAVLARTTAGGRRPGDVENLGGAEGLGLGAFAGVGTMDGGQEGGGQGSGAPVVASVSEEQRAVFRRNSRVHFAAMCYCIFLEGWNDGSTGPLLPVIQKHYGVSRTRASITV